MADVSRKEILLAGKPVRLNGEDILKVAVIQWGKTTGVDIRSWYKPKPEKLEAMSSEDKAKQDSMGYFPGKGVFLPLTHVANTHAKLGQIMEHETFKKLLADVKAGETSKVDPEKEKLKAEVEEMRKLLSDLRAATAASAPTTTKTASDAGEIDEIEIPSSAVAKGKPRK